MLGFLKCLYVCGQSGSMCLMVVNVVADLDLVQVLRFHMNKTNQKNIMRVVQNSNISVVFRDMFFFGFL